MPFLIGELGLLVIFGFILLLFTTYWVLVHARDISKDIPVIGGGIAGVFARGWDVGASVSLQFSVPVATTPVRVRGVVRNRTGYRYGFEFVELTPQQQETISRTCRTLGLLQ